MIFALVQTFHKIQLQYNKAAQKISGHLETPNLCLDLNGFIYLMLVHIIIARDNLSIQMELVLL